MICQHYSVENKAKTPAKGCRNILHSKVRNWSIQFSLEFYHIFKMIEFGNK